MYKEFREVAVGQAFGRDFEWVKQSTRTARTNEAGRPSRPFYFRQSDIVFQHPPTKDAK